MRSQTRSVRAHERQLQALELRKAGATYAAIATQLGYRSPQAAHKAVGAALKLTLKDPADAVRDLELQRLDAMLLPLWRRVQVGDDAAVDRALKIMDRRAKLLGLDAPQRRELSGKEGGPIQHEYDFSQLSDEELERELLATAAQIEMARAAAAETPQGERQVAD